MSKSARITWDIGVQTTSYKLYRNTVNDFGTAALIATLGANVSVYNDYGLLPSTLYYYWIVRVYGITPSPETGPVSVTTNPVQTFWPDVNVLKDALYDWAFGEFLGKYPVIFVRQDLPKLQKPFVTLKLAPLEKPGLFDDERSMNEALVGARILGVTVGVFADPTPPQRVQVEIDVLGAGDYTVTIGSADPITVNYGTAPATKLIVATDLVALINAAGFKSVVNGIEDDEGFQIEKVDGSDIDTTTTSANLIGGNDRPVDAMQIASQLQGSLGDADVRLDLQAAGLGIGTVSALADIAALLDTKFEDRYQFDFKASIAFSRPLSLPVIDTVTDTSGTVTA